MNCTLPALTLKQIEEESANDKTIQKIQTALETSEWPKELIKYKIHAGEYCFVGNILLRGLVIVIPEVLQCRVIELAHESHMGMTKTKMQLRQKIWWPGNNNDIEKRIYSCKECKLMSVVQPAEPMQRHKMPSKSWQEVAVDLMGPTPSGHHVLVLEDYYSHFSFIRVLRSTKASDIINAFREIFAERGNPHMIRMDNGPQFNCHEVKA